MGRKGEFEFGSVLACVGFGSVGALLGLAFGFLSGIQIKYIFRGVLDTSELKNQFVSVSRASHQPGPMGCRKRVRSIATRARDQR